MYEELFVGNINHMEKKTRKNGLLDIMDMSELQMGGNKQTRLLTKLCNKVYHGISVLRSRYLKLDVYYFFLW